MVNRPKAKIKEFFILNSKHAGEDYKNKLKLFVKF